LSGCHGTDVTSSGWTGDVKAEVGLFCDWLTEALSANSSNTGFTGGVLDAINSVSGIYKFTADTICAVATGALNLIPNTLPGGQQAEWATIGGHALTLGIAGWIERVTAIPMRELTQSVRYTLNYHMPVLLPEQQGFDILYLTDRISDEQWECFTRAINHLPNTHRAIRDAQQARLNISEVMDLYMRKLISEDELYKELRARGVTDPSQIQWWQALRTALPTETDLIPFMVRDVVNPNINWESSDAWFEQNYSGVIAEWGAKLGIDPEVMKMRARQHWQLPSNTVLFEMMARNRPGRVEEKLTVTMQDARKLLQQNDMEPSWIDKVLSVSYLPLTRTDIKMGIKNRTITNKEDAKQYLEDARIDPKFSELIANILWDDAQRQVANETNLWSRAKVTKFYKEGLIDREKAASLLARFVPNEEQRYQQLDDADDQVGMDVRRECIKAVKNRVLRAEITESEASQQLVALGIPTGRSDQLAQSFVCYRASRGTELTLRYLHKIWLQGLLSPEELYIRFANLRYTEEDARLLLQSWGIELQESQRKEAERELKARNTEIRSARSRYRTEVAWLQKQTDRLRKQTKQEGPFPPDAVDTNGAYVPPNPQPPIP
jgi:hypothetical protein